MQKRLVGQAKERAEEEPKLKMKKRKASRSKYDREIIHTMTMEVRSLLRMVSLAARTGNRRWLASALRDLSSAQDDLSRAIRQWSLGQSAISNPLGPESPGDFLEMAREAIETAERYRGDYKRLRKILSPQERGILMRKWKQAEHTAIGAVAVLKWQYYDRDWPWTQRLEREFALYIR
jgi:hypothetical protein